MTGNSFGKIFKITTFGESHGKAVGVIVDGCPSGILIDSLYIQNFLNERRSYNNPFTTPRREPDLVDILSGIYDNKTLGTPIMLMVHNKVQQEQDYNHLKNVFRPNHADFTWYSKYNHVDYRGGGRSSARETVGRVAGAGVAYKLLELQGIKIDGFLLSIGEETIRAENINILSIANNNLLCPDDNMLAKWQEILEKAVDSGDSLGSIVEIRIRNCPIGLGEPVFDKLNANLAKGLFSIPAVRGVEFGDGFNMATKHGSKVNDAMYIKDNKVHFSSNNSAGILGGISTGEEIIIKIAIKPTSSIRIAQQTVNKNLQEEILEVKGRHDPCIGIRAVSVCKAMCALVITDHLLQANLYKDS